MSITHSEKPHYLLATLCPFKANLEASPQLILPPRKLWSLICPYISVVTSPSPDEWKYLSAAWKFLFSSIPQISNFSVKYYNFRTVHSSSSNSFHVRLSIHHHTVMLFFPRDYKTEEMNTRSESLQNKSH